MGQKEPRTQSVQNVVENSEHLDDEDDTEEEEDGKLPADVIDLWTELFNELCRLAHPDVTMKN